MHEHKPIILIGFKSTGKTAIGHSLAKKMNLPFIDLDNVIETYYHETTGEKLNCRQIFKKHGIDYFRTLESEMLKKTLMNEEGILSVGGGTPLRVENLTLLSKGIVIHVQAPKGMVFERIMIGGRPAFFPENEEAYEAFERIWDERSPIYKKLAEHTILNNSTIDSAVDEIIRLLSTKEKT